MISRLGQHLRVVRQAYTRRHLAFSVRGDKVEFGPRSWDKLSFHIGKFMFLLSGSRGPRGWWWYTFSKAREQHLPRASHVLPTYLQTTLGVPLKVPIPHVGSRDTVACPRSQTPQTSASAKGDDTVLKPPGN